MLNRQMMAHCSGKKLVVKSLLACLLVGIALLQIDVKWDLHYALLVFAVLLFVILKLYLFLYH